jgi:hypothetical protein
MYLLLMVLLLQVRLVVLLLVVHLLLLLRCEVCHGIPRLLLRSISTHVAAITRFIHHRLCFGDNRARVGCHHVALVMLSLQCCC